MLDVLKNILELGTQSMVAVAAVFGVRFAWRLRRHNQQTQFREDKHHWRAKVVTGINNYLRLSTTSSSREGFDLDILQRPHQDPHLKGPYCAVSGVEVNEPERRVESLASHDVEQAELVDALVEGLGLLGLGELTRDRDWLLANTLLGGAGDDIERRSTDLVPAASVPPDERNKYRFALVRHEPFVVWVYLMDAKADRRKTWRGRQRPGCAAHHPHSTASTPRRTPTPGLGSPRRATRRQPKCERGGIAIGRFLPRERPREPQASSSPRVSTRRCAQQREVLRCE